MRFTVSGSAIVAVLLVVLVSAGLWLLLAGGGGTGSRQAAEGSRMTIAPARPSAAPVTIGPTAELRIGPEPAIMVTPGDGPRTVIRESVTVRTASPVIVTPSPISPVEIGPAPAMVVTVTPSPGPVAVAPSAPMILEPVRRGVWDERGWSKLGDSGREVFAGNYEVLERRSGQRRRYQGRVEMQRGVAVPHIAAPPPGITGHPKWACFHRMGDRDWFRINWHRPARHADDAILYVEKILDEVLNGPRQN